MTSTAAFPFHAPASLPEALERLRDLPGACLIAGGTDLVVLMKDRLQRPSALISLGRVEALKDIRRGSDGLDLGAMVSLGLLERRPEVERSYPALAQALRFLAAPPIRNQATLGGNLCLDTKCLYYNQSRRWPRNLSPCLKAGGGVCHVAPAGRRCFAALAGDTVGPLLLYGAELTLARAEGERRIPLQSFFTNDGLRPLQRAADELLSRVHLPPPAPRSAVAYTRFAYRKALEFSQVNLSVSLRLDEGGRVGASRMVVGGVGPAPVEVTDCLKGLLGERPSARLWQAAAEEAPQEALRRSKSPRLTLFIRSVLRAHAARLLETCHSSLQESGA